MAAEEAEGDLAEIGGDKGTHTSMVAVVDSKVDAAVSATTATPGEAALLHYLACFELAKRRLSALYRVKPQQNVIRCGNSGSRARSCYIQS